MKNFILFFAFLGALSAQTLTLNGPATVKQGRTFNLNVTLSGAVSTAPSAVQWTLNPASGLTLGSTSTSVPNKSVQCGTTTSPICLFYGINQTPATNGIIATHTINVPVTTPLGTKQFTLTAPIAVTQAGSNWPISSGSGVASPYTIIVTAVADINNDGVINSADVGLMADQVTGGTCTDDQNGDSACNIIDVYLVVLRALGV